MTDKGRGFIAYARACIERMRNEGRYDAARKLEMYIRKFVTYLGRDEITFRDFNSLLVHGYHAWLENQRLGRNTVALYVRNLKRVYRSAVAEGLADECRPFEGVDVSYRAKKDKDRLTPREIMRMRYMDVSSLCPSAVFARDIFLFAVFTKGMTGGDILYLTKDNIKDGRLTYTSKVTCRKETVRWTPFMQETVDRYARSGTPYLFPIITAKDPEEQWRQHDVALHNINRNLKKVGQAIGLSFPLNLTAARHSWKKLSKSLEIGDLV